MMKTTRTLILLTICSLLFPGVAAQAEVYKTVDKDGNVVFTDKKPSADAEPMKLKELIIQTRYQLPIIYLFY